MFSKNTGNAERENFMSILDISTEARSEKYLGLLAYIDGSKRKTFEYLKECVWKRI